MKEIYLPLIFLFVAQMFLSAQTIDFPDENFKSALLSDGVDTNNNGFIEVSEVEALTSLSLVFDNISDLTGIEYFTNLETLICSNNNLNDVDLSSNTLLRILRMRSNDITSINLSNNLLLEELNLQDNQLTNLNLQNNTALVELSFAYNNISAINLTNNTLLENLVINNNQLTEIDLSHAPALRRFFDANNNITDYDFTNNSNLRRVTIQSNPLVNTINISDKPNLYLLDFYENDSLSSVNVTNCNTLSNIRCTSNPLLTTLTVTNCSSLNTIDCKYNQITSLDLSTLINLDQLYCEYNMLTSLILNDCIREIRCFDNLITDLDLSNNSCLFELIANDNMLTNIDLSGTENLFQIGLFNNQLTELDFSDCTSLRYFSIRNNTELRYLNLKNGQNEHYMFTNGYSNLPSLETICIDDINSPFTNHLQTVLNDNVTITDYCSFTPGGEYYTISGDAIIDINADGCDDNDLAYQYLPIQVTNGTNNWSYYTTDQGEYNIHLPNIDTYTVTTQLENNQYFTITPEEFIVDFSNNTSPFVNDFCITPNGVFNDLEISMIPLSDAIPGFDIPYKIIYKNKGTETVSGEINLSFEGNFMDVLEVSPELSSQDDNNISWFFTNLLPFESREIIVTMSLNTPTETNFPLNSGDTLTFQTTITSTQEDETPEDNTFVLEVDVINSYDPNDKTCLQGNTIKLEQVGGYLYYLIRFENLGTANAINVVIKDVIDTNVFDVLTLIPLSASHNFETKIRENNQVEFIFENINLPYDETNNDGYVLFKIKSLSTLQIADTINNQANIYFDYNAPVITNVETTEVIANLSVDSFENHEEIILYPNPVVDELYFDSSKQIDNIYIYNLKGKIVYKQNALITNKIDMRNLQSGFYFIKLSYDNRYQIKKILKQ